MKKLLALKNLTKKEIYKLFHEFPHFSPEKQSAILTLLRSKGETIEEILGVLQYFGEHTKTIQQKVDLVDIVGTGGDGVNTFNISTAASLVIAHGGVFVAKHGGKSATGKVGSQEVVSALGIPMFQREEEISKALSIYRYVYLWAPLFNEELKKYSLLRKQLGFPTVFNLIGPLLNPLSPKRKVIGVYRKDLLEKIAIILKMQCVEHAMVVHSEDGLDELSISSATHIVEIKKNTIYRYRIQPEELGIPRALLSTIKCQGLHGNVKIIEGVLSGEIKGPKSDVVALNAAAGLYVSGKAKNFAEGVEMAKQILSNGDAINLLNQLRRG